MTTPHEVPSASPSSDNLTDEDYAKLEEFVTSEKALRQPIPGLESASPIDTVPYMPKLKPLDIPKFKPAKDRTKPIKGFGPGTPQGHRDMVRELSLHDEILLLRDNNIELSPNADSATHGEMAAVVLGDNLRPSNHLAVRFKEVSLLDPGVNRVDTENYAYKAFESNVQRQTAMSSSLGFGIPKIFKFDASYSDTSATATYGRKVQIYLQASQLVPKAKVVLQADDISLDPKFVEKVKDACDRKKVEILLDILKEWGHFVPLSMMLGGRITLHTLTELNDKSEFASQKREFKAAADARFKVDGVPVEGGGGAGAGTGTTGTSTLSDQAIDLLMELKGGNENLASSEAGTLGTQWIGSLGPYREWKIAGFYEDSLVPIIEFLDPKLCQTCKKLLRDYFLSKLDETQSAVAGYQHGDEFKFFLYSFSPPPISLLARVVEIKVNHGINVDGLEVGYEGSNPGSNRKNKYGRWRGEHTETIRLSKDEEITAIEAGIDNERIMRRVAFVTNRRRWPATDFFGRAKTSELKTIEAPRVTGVFGSSGAVIHSLGLTYRGLAGNAKSREYLLAMEPYLFPNGIYGILGIESV